MNRPGPVTPYLPHALVLCVLLPLLAACGAPKDTTPAPDDGLTWHGHPPPIEGSREFVPVLVPEVRYARADDPGEPGVPRLVLNIQSDGLVSFKGMVYRLGEGAEERTAALRALRAELAALTADRRWHRAGGKCRIPVLLFADRAAPWSAAAVILSLLPVHDVGVDQIQFTALRWADPHRHMRVDGVLHTAPLDEPDLTVTLESRGRDARRRTSITLTGVGQTIRLEFPAGVRLDDVRRDEAWHMAANEVWARIGARLSATPLIPRFEGAWRADVRVLTPAEVEMGYVMTVVDLLRGRGVYNIAFPDAASPEDGFRVAFEPVFRTERRETGRDGWGTRWVLAAVAAVVAGGLVLLVAMLRRRGGKA